MGNIYLTREGYERLKKEIELLKEVRDRQLSKKTESAGPHGDKQKKAEYKMAEETHTLIEKKIAELEEKLRYVQILDSSDIPKNGVLIGSTVKLKDLNIGEEVQYTLVSEAEADFFQGKISTTAPVGKTLLGHKKDETVEIRAPAGILKYRILDIL